MVPFFRMWVSGEFDKTVAQLVLARRFQASFPFGQVRQVFLLVRPGKNIWARFPWAKTFRPCLKRAKLPSKPMQLLLEETVSFGYLNVKCNRKNIYNPSVLPSVSIHLQCLSKNHTFKNGNIWKLYGEIV